MSNASDFIIENGVLKEYVGSGGDVVIPESVSNIYPTAFHKSNGIKSITIPGKIRFIGGGAFYPCKELRTIVSPEVPFSVYKEQESPAKRAVGLGFLENIEVYQDPVIAEEYKKYAMSQRKHLLAAVWESDCVSAVQFYADNKKITAANFENDYLTPAINASATSCIAFLLEWKEAHTILQSIEKQAEKELVKDPYNAADMKKIWAYKKLSNGTLELTSYKGNENCVTVPAHIGKTPVTALGEYLFSPETAFGEKTQARAKVMRNISQVIIPEGITRIGSWAFFGSAIERITFPNSVTTIDYGAFRECNNLSDVMIPNSVTFIHGIAFYLCPNVKIKAPAGSYAERYAKENHIPFVAE